MKNAIDAYLGEWDFDDSCAPNEDGSGGYYGQSTFTLGCFQWVHRTKFGVRRGLKKGRVQYRIKGNVGAPAEAYQAARAFCAKKNSESAQ